MTTSAAIPTPRSAEEQARLEASLTEMFEQRITFNTVLGLKMLSVKPGDVRGRIAMRPELVGHYAYGRLHGGVISATLDAMGGLALMVGIWERHASDTAFQVMHRFMKMGTIDLRIDYLRPGLGQHFIATAEVTRLGGRLGSTQMRLVNDEGTLIATGAAAYVVS
ncbi:MAG: thioesterase family protein [Rubrivivax sp.]